MPNVDSKVAKVDPIKALDAAFRATRERVKADAAKGVRHSAEAAVSLLGRVARETLAGLASKVKVSEVRMPSARAAADAPAVSKALLKRMGGDMERARRHLESKRFSREKHRAKLKALAAGQPWPPAEGPYAGDPKPAQALGAKAKGRRVVAAAKPKEPALGRPVTVKGEWGKPRTRKAPAVDPKRSVFKDFIVCLEDGKRYTMLKRPLRTHFGMTPEEYKAKWGLPEAYPMTPPGYSERKREEARRVGLGHRTAEFRTAAAREKVSA